MNEPTFDRDGYPTDETLDRIENWEVKTFSDALDAMDFVGRAWYYPDRWERRTTGHPITARREVEYAFSTGGWSGNESLVGAIEKNTMLQMLGAWSWQRGGHYVYRFPTTDGAVYGLPR